MNNLKNSRLATESWEEVPKFNEDKLGTILLVEDNVTIAKMASKMLTNQGHTVHLAYIGEQALSLWEDHRWCIDVIFCDVDIDSLYNGPYLAKRFKKQKPSLKIVLTSGFTREVAIESYGLTPNSLFISKPFTGPALTDVIQKALRD